MNQKEFWNNKFKNDDFLYGLKANEFLASNINKFEKNMRILCLGEGEGRNAIFFAKEGFDVTAIDSSDVALAKLQKRAQNENLNIKTFCIDLNSWQNSEKYDVILISYLHMHKEYLKELLKKIENSLTIGGYFIGEFFSKEQLNYNSGGPKDIDFLYNVEDFNNYFIDFKKDIKEEIVVLDEGDGHQGLASVIRVIIKKEN